MNDPSVTATPVTRLFTFGYGQACPFTGKDLGDHYALVTAPDRSSALRTMLATFGRNWAFEYEPESPTIADYIPRMTLHAQLVIGAGVVAVEPGTEKPECGAWCADGQGGLCSKDAGHDGPHGDQDAA